MTSKDHRTRDEAVLCLRLLRISLNRFSLRMMRKLVEPWQVSSRMVFLVSRTAIETSRGGSEISPCRAGLREP